MKAATVSFTNASQLQRRAPDLLTFSVLIPSSHAVGPVVLVGASKHAVSLVRFLLDVLEEVRRPEDAQQGRRHRGEDLPQSCKQRKLRHARTPW